MKTKVLVLSLISAVLVAATCSLIDDPEPEVNAGCPIPSFSLETLEGTTISDTSLKGHDAVIVFFNTWCPDCHKVLPVIQRWADEDPAKETTYLCIARDQTNEEIKSSWKEDGYTMKAAGDPGKRVYNLFTGKRSYGVPVVYIIDDTGRCVKRILQDEELER